MEIRDDLSSNEHNTCFAHHCVLVQAWALTDIYCILKKDLAHFIRVHVIHFGATSCKTVMHQDIFGAS